ncbi:MAG: hypothetical protein WAO76_09710 [Georgfuchsia sp.]
MTGSRTNQCGIALLEALIAIVIFLIGALTLIALQATSIAAQADAQYRIEAANRVDQIIGEINLNVDRTSAATTQTTLADYAYNITTDGACNFSGGTESVSGTAPVAVSDWVDAMTDDTLPTYFPGATTAMQQILVAPGTFNRITVTVCWQAPGDAVTRQHSVIAYIN